jgi:DNA-binding transcriptional ArsR family regulator
MRSKEKGIEMELKAMANKRRLAIIKFLYQKKEATVGEITDSIKLSFKATSKHLGVLKTADIVDHDQRSLSYYYHLTTPLPASVKAILSLF